MNEASIWTLASWFRDEGGRLGGAKIQWNGGTPTFVAARNLAAGDPVLTVPLRLCVTSDTARNSATGLRLIPTRPKTERAYFGTFLADTRLRGGYWRPMVDALPRTMAHRPDAFCRADWALMQGSHAQHLALQHRQSARAHFRHTRRVLPAGLRIPVRDYWWGWQASTMLTFGLSIGGESRSAIAPFGELFGHSFAANCTFAGDHSKQFEIRTSDAVLAGQPLTVSYGPLTNARLFAQYGLWVDDNPHDAVHLAFPLERDHWVHAYAKDLTRGSAAPGFDVEPAFDTKPAVEMMSLLRLVSLGSEAAARAHPVLRRAAQPGLVPPLDVDNETQALSRLVRACESAQARFADPVDEDDRLLAEAALTARQRGAISVRRGEKRLLHGVLALAREALDVLQRPAAERNVALERLAHTHAASVYFTQLRQWLGDAPRAAPPPRIAVFTPPEPVTDALLSPQEQRLLDWFQAQGGQLMGVAIGRRDGLRGMVATRDIAKGQHVLIAPRHLCLSQEIASNSAIGLRLRQCEHVAERDIFGAYLVQEQRLGGSYWQPMLDALPRRFDGRPEFWNRADWELLEGSSVKHHCGGFWKHLLHKYRVTQAALPPALRMRLREFVWGHLATSTRTFTFMADGESSSAMVPVAEMFNHSVDPNCDWGGNHTSRFIVSAGKDIAAGTPLTISYGQRGNQHLLKQYGFCIDGNPHDLATLWFRVPRDHWLRSYAKELIGQVPSVKFEIGKDPSLEEGRRLLSYLRLASLPGADAARADARIDEKKPAEVPVLDVENERRALQKLIDACEGRLDDFSCSTGKDDDLLASGQLTPAGRNAVIVRRGEKQVLRHTIDHASLALFALDLPEHERRVVLIRRASDRAPWSGYFRSLLDALPSPRDAAAAAPRQPEPVVIPKPAPAANPARSPATARPPAATVTPREPSRGAQDEASLRRDFLRDGFVVVKNVFSPDYIRELQAHFLRTYERYLEDKQFNDALRVGDKRTMITIELEGPFNRPALYANDRVLNLVKGLLGPRIIFSALGGVASLPGADVQKIHRDHPGLFAETEPAMPLLPPYGITVIVPLVPLTPQNGTTRMYAGSQKATMAVARECPTVDPYTELGDCIFMDYRTLHRGLPNQSEGVRPILYVVYGANWFRDGENYALQKPLSCTPQEFEKVPDEHRYLVNWLKRGVV